MNREFQTKLNEYAKARKTRRKWLTVVASLCAVVALGTSYLLINPATTQQQETFCGFEEHKEHASDCYEKVLACQLSEEGHKHSKTCYEEQQVLTCSLSESDGHTHSDTCYGTEEYLSCGSEETDGHQHGEDCYGTERVLICNDANEEHEHTDECYEENEVLTCQLKECEPHHHDETCYSTRQVLICNEEETAPHQHDDSCYETQTVCTCGMEECEPHQHSEACYEINRDHLMCELPIHEHTLQCFSNPEADIETASVWERTFRNVKLTGKWDEDVLAIAQTQLGYTESTANYEVQEDGTTMKGYTRYGDWYGNSYGDWCAMFCSFCLHYAEVDRDLMPIEASCQRWIDKLEVNEPNLYHPAHNEVFADGTKVFEQEEDKYVPAPGDLIFLDWENYDPENLENRDADHIGLVAELIYDETTNEIIKIKTIEGNSGDTVRYNTYDIADSSILGYGELPDNPDYLVTKTVTLDDDIVVSVSGRAASYPYPEEEISLHAEILHDSTAEEFVNACLEEEGIVPMDILLLDVSLIYQGEEIEPIGPVKLTFETGSWIEPSAVYHVDEKAETVTDMEAEISDEDGILTVETDHFSTFALANDGSSAKKVSGSVDAEWVPGEDGEAGHLSFTIKAISSDLDNVYFGISCYDGSSWLAPSTWTSKFRKNDEVTVVNGASLDSFWSGSYVPGPDTLFHVLVVQDTNTLTNNTGYSSAFSIKQILENTKSGFSAWMTEKGYAPATISELYTYFDEYYSLPVVTISSSPYAGHQFVDAAVDQNGTYHYHWQYKDENDQWQDFGSDVSRFDSSMISELARGKTIRCCLYDADDSALLDVSNEIFVDPSASSTKPTLEAVWNPNTNTVGSFAATVSFETGQKTVYLECSDDETSWTNVGSTSFDNKSSVTSCRIEDTGTVNGQSLDRQWRMHVDFKDNNKTDFSQSFDVFDILEACKGGFNDWLLNSYVQSFGGAHLPTDQEELYAAFAVYYGLPTATVNMELNMVDGQDQITLNCILDHTPADPHYEWEYYDESIGEWCSLIPDDTDSFDVTDLALLNGGKLVRVKVYDSEQLVTVSPSRLVDNQDVSALLKDAIDAINRELDLEHYPIEYTYVTHNNATMTQDLSIGGFRYKNMFYWDNLAKDPRVPVTGDTRQERADSYAEYLARAYLKGGIDEAERIWKRYLFDIYDPTYDTGNVDSVNNYGQYNSATGEYNDYGDRTLANLKDTSNSSYHTTGSIAPEIQPLKSGFGDAGIDYQYFVSELSKYAEADAAGDANEERKYKIDLTADCQASAPGPVALIFQIQSSWQMFDLYHANALKDEGDNTANGAVANNTELGTLYDIKNALLGLCDYMETTYPGNNLVIGITETKHDKSQTMFYAPGKTENGVTIHPMYVTNNYDDIRTAVENMDTFGNCEHVHYSDAELVNAVTNLPYNLDGWSDFFGNPIYLDDIQKAAVIIGGPTENSAGTNGYKCPLPFTDTFSNTYTYTKEGDATSTTSPLLNSVYGIRTNNGTSYVTSGTEKGTLSWLDYSENNKGIPFKDGNGAQNFTQKYVATNEQAILNALINIVEKESKVKKVDIQAQDKFVDDVTVNDTVTDEFRLDPDAPFVATIWNSDKYGYESEMGHEMYKTVIDWKTGTVQVYQYEAGVACAPITIQANIDVSTDANGDRVTTISFTEEQVIKYTVTSLTEGDTDYVLNKNNPQELVIVEHIGSNGDGTTDVSYNFGTVYNTKKCELNFGVIAKDDYIGSNNVYTNEGTADLSYSHTDLEHNVDTDYIRRGSDTPQVNVPIDYSVIDGGYKKVSVNTEVSLDTDPELLRDVMTEEIEDLLDNYDQINGTLNYTWIDSRGNIVKDCGTVPVLNGTVANWPDTSQLYTPTEAGIEVFTLQVTFTPNNVDPNNRNFHNDGKTPVAVSPQIRRGELSVEAVDDSHLLNYKVVKTWAGTPPSDVDRVQFRLTDGEGNYVQSDGSGGWTFTNSSAAAQVFELTAADQWECEITDLPPMRLVGSDYEVIQYVPEEVEVSGYVASYSNDALLNQTYDEQAEIQVTLTNNTGAAISKNNVKFVHIDFTYNGQHYSEDVSITLNSDLPVNGSVTLTLPVISGVDLTIPDTTKPDVYPYQINEVFVYKGNKGAYDTVMDIAAAKIQSKLLTAQVTPILRIANTPTTTTLTVSKSVPGRTDPTAFPFTATLASGSFPAPPSEAGYTVDANGVAHFELANGDEIELNVPVGAVVTIKETSHDGYYPLIKVNCADNTLGDAVTVTVDRATTVEFENTSGYELPETGGPGTIPYTLGGLVLMTGALMYGCMMRCRRERRSE